MKIHITTLLAIAICAACGPKATEQASPQPDVTPVPVKVYLTKFAEADVARFTIAAIMSQPPKIIRVERDASTGNYMVSYTRKSDNTKFYYKIKVVEDRVAWGEFLGRWRTQPEDETITFSEGDDKLKITQTFSDGSTIDKEFSQMDKPVEEIKAEVQEPATLPIGTGKITTIADGYDVQRVNLWSSTGYDRVTTSFLTNGEKVIILEDEEPYYLIETASGDGRKGYCMKEFVIMNKK